MLYDARHVYLNGEAFAAGGRDARLMRQLADRAPALGGRLRALSAARARAAGRVGGQRAGCTETRHEPARQTGDAAPVIDSRAAWQAALRWGLDAAMARGARRITCVDAGFENWPLDDPALLQRLTAWLRLPQRRLVLLARQYDEVPRRFPRFTAWRRDFAARHRSLAGRPRTVRQGLPSLLVDDGAGQRATHRRRPLARPRERRSARRDAAGASKLTWFCNDRSRLLP